MKENKIYIYENKNQCDTRDLFKVIQFVHKPHPHPKSSAAPRIYAQHKSLQQIKATILFVSTISLVHSLPLHTHMRIKGKDAPDSVLDHYTKCSANEKKKKKNQENTFRKEMLYRQERRVRLDFFIRSHPLRPSHTTNT